MFKKVKKVTISSPQKNDLPKPQTRSHSSDYLNDDEGADNNDSDQRVRALSRHSRTGSLDRKKRYNTSSTSLNKSTNTRAPAKSPQVKQEVLTVNPSVGHTRKHSVPDNFHKPPSPKETEVAGDPLMVDKSKQSINPSLPLTNKSVSAIQQQQRISAQSNPKSSPPLANKRTTAIPRKPMPSSMTTSKSIGHTGGLAEMDYQMSLPNSNSNEELSSILSDYNDGPPSPPPVVMETQPDQSLQFSRFLSQQVPINDHSSKLTSPPKVATSQKPSAIPVQNFVANPSYHYTPLVKPPPVLTNHTTPTLNQPLVSRGVDKRYPTPTNGVPKPSTSPIPMSPKYLINPVQPFPQLPLPSKLPVASSTVSRQSSRQRTVEKAMRARLYLLEQPGPNTFLVTGDSNESRFRVIVGTQKCSCNKPDCIHLLFVMLRVLKVSQNDPKLWSRELKNYEVESLMNDYHSRRLMSPNKRNSMRRSKSVPSKQHHYSSSSSVTSFMATGGSDGGSSLQSVLPISGNIVENVTIENSMSGTVTNDNMMVAEQQQKEQVFVNDDNGMVTMEAGIDSDEEDEICPICLLEIVEGEDLLECINGCHIELHRHCMEIWGTEQRRRGDNFVKCPVCMASWDHMTPRPSSIMRSHDNPPAPVFPTTPIRNQDSPLLNNTRSTMPASTPDTSTPTPLLRQRTLSRVDTTSFFLDSYLPEKLYDYLMKLEKYVSKHCLDQIFSSTWKSREAGLQQLARDMVSLLMPSFTHRHHSSRQLSDEDVQQSSIAHYALEACCPIIAHSSTDSVLKVYLASLELCRVILCHSLCDCGQDLQELRRIFKPILCVILVRCADAQNRARDCSQDFLHHLCMGQDGPLAIGSACGHPTVQEFGGVHFVCSLAFEMPPIANPSPSGHWWLGRLLFLEHAMSAFGPHFIPPKVCEATNSTVSASSSAPGDPSDLLLVNVWRFASAATHVQQQKVTKIAIRVYKKSIELALDCPAILDQSKEAIDQCHSSVQGLVREVVGKLLAQKGIAKPSKKHRKYGINFNSTAFRDKHSVDNELKLSVPRPDQSYVENDLSRDFSKNLDISSEIEDMSGTHENLNVSTSQGYNQDFVAGNMDSVFQQPVYVESRYNHVRAGRHDSSCSDLDVSQDRSTTSRAKPTVSSNESSDVPKQTTSESSSNGDHVSSDEHNHISAVMARQFSKEMEGVTMTKDHDIKHQESTGSGGHGTEVLHCKREVEEEEAMALAQVQSLVEEDQPHPPISLAPPTETVIIHVQPDNEDTTDGKYDVYRQDNEWVKGKPIGSGAYCSCFLSQDIKTGTIMATKQVSYIRNTSSEEEEEQKRLTKEVSLLMKLKHPNIVRCLGATQQPGCFNIFLEWMAGGSIERLLHDFGAFHPLVIANYTKQVIFGLAFLHNHGIIHRDLKGANILVDSTGQRLRIADLGAAARLAAHITEDDEFRNDVQGTVPFMAPEVVRGEHYGRSCDVWSVGCCIIQMATGKPPWNATGSTNKFALIYKIATATESPPMPDGLTIDVRDLGIRCMELKPEDRPKSADLLKHALFRN